MMITMIMWSQLHIIDIINWLLTESGWVRGTEVDLLGPSTPVLDVQLPVGLSHRVRVH